MKNYAPQDGLQPVLNLRQVEIGARYLNPVVFDLFLGGSEYDDWLSLKT